MQPLYRQWLHGDREYDAWLLDQRRTLANDAPLVSGHSMTGEGVYSDETGPGLDIYYKGTLLLHSLRALIGDEAFFRANRELVYGRAEPGPGDRKRVAWGKSGSVSVALGVRRLIEIKNNI